MYCVFVVNNGKQWLLCPQWGIATSVSVCLSITRPIFTKLSVGLHVTCGHGSVLRWQQCNMLCSSGFVDDVMFSHNGAYFAFVLVTGCLSDQCVCVWCLYVSLYACLLLVFPHLWIAHGGQSLLPLFALYYFAAIVKHYCSSVQNYAIGVQFIGATTV